MAFAPLKQSNKLRMFSAPRPNYKDFSGPPNGDYVRYVEGLMLWAEQEQERLRLKALGDKARSSNDSQWGRGSSAPPVASVNVPMAQPGSVDSPMERWKRKAKAQAAKVQQQAQKTAKQKSRIEQGTGGAKKKAKSNALPALFLVAGFALAGIFAPAWMPAVIIGWVVFNLIRVVRAASGAGKF
ncbi:MAG TPA: hypothetical protein VIG85_00565 [Comamonas sp.]